MADPSPSSGDISDLVKRFAGLERRISDLEKPSGTQRYQAVDKLTELVSNIQQQLDDYIANDAYTKAQVDTAIATEIGAAFAAFVSGPVTFAGALTVNGHVQVNSTATVTGAVHLANVPAITFVTQPRKTVWVDTSNGRLGVT